ncbi:Mum2 [Kluyveromyces lactis]|nr:Mum2 [Kluyveromyces lactis]
MYGTTANVMNSSMPHGGSFSLHGNIDGMGSHYNQGLQGHLSGSSTHRSSMSSYWEQPLIEQHNSPEIESSRGISSNAHPGSSSNNTVIMDRSSYAKSSGFNTTFDSETEPSSDNFKLELQLKETQIESLEIEIKKLKEIFNQGLTFKQQEEQKMKKSKAFTFDSEIQIPASLEIIFCKLSDSLKRKDQELQETKRRLEGIVTAVALNPSNSTTKFGRYDEEALAHKMVTRLETLMKENEEMAKMLSYGRVKETSIELELLRKENQELKERLKILQQEK